MHSLKHRHMLLLQAPKGQRGAKTVDGFEITVGINYYGPLYLTELLIPIMRRSSAPKTITKRIVWVTSLGSQLVNPPIIGEGSGWPGISLVPWDDLKCAPHFCIHAGVPPHITCMQGIYMLCRPHAASAEVQVCMYLHLPSFRLLCCGVAVRIIVVVCA